MNQANSGLAINPPRLDMESMPIRNAREVEVGLSQSFKKSSRGATLRVFLSKDLLKETGFLYVTNVRVNEAEGVFIIDLGRAVNGESNINNVFSISLPGNRAVASISSGNIRANNRNLPVIPEVKFGTMQLKAKLQGTKLVFVQPASEIFNLIKANAKPLPARIGKARKNGNGKHKKLTPPSKPVSKGKGNNAHDIALDLLLSSKPHTDFRNNPELGALHVLQQAVNKLSELLKDEISLEVKDTGKLHMKRVRHIEY